MSTEPAAREGSANLADQLTATAQDASVRLRALGAHLDFDYQGDALFSASDVLQVTAVGAFLLGQAAAAVAQSPRSVFFTTHTYTLDEERSRLLLQVAYPDAGDPSTFARLSENARVTRIVAPDTAGSPLSLAGVTFEARSQPGYSQTHSSGEGTVLQFEVTLGRRHPTAPTGNPLLSLPQAWLIGATLEKDQALRRRLQRDGWIVRHFSKVDDARRELDVKRRPSPALVIGHESSGVSAEALGPWGDLLPPGGRLILGVGKDSLYAAIAGTAIGKLEFWMVPFSPGDLRQIKLSASRWETEHSGHTAPASLDSGRPLVLVVDDNEVNRILATQMLRVLQCDSETAESGLEALEYCQRLRPSAVLMDVNMPVMDGLEATRRLRQFEQHGLTPLPIIASTTDDSPSTRRACEGAGMNAFLVKPLSLASLAQQLRTGAGLAVEFDPSGRH